MAGAEARILRSKNVLLALSPADGELARDFYGDVVSCAGDPRRVGDLAGRSVYLCGDLSALEGVDLSAARRVFVVRDLCQHVEAHQDRDGWRVVDRGRVPVSVHGLGVYYRRFFDGGERYFHRVRDEHAFQSLTESVKTERAHRTGVYLTQVTPDGDALRFRLLRCSTNLAGPTENLRATDRHIVDAVDREADEVFDRHAPLNHVLAQIYPNAPARGDQRQTKARISSHADKTKDMPVDGVMAFCTFYDGLDALAPMPEDPFDLGHKRASGLTRLRFRAKEPPGDGLPSQFDVTLYPDSVLFIPLSTNRLYTHEIVPSSLGAERLPTRLGYVVRCSKTEAVHAHGQTSLVGAEGLVALAPPTPEAMADLRAKYAEENRSAGPVDYGDRFQFSMNEGDYRAPDYRPSDEFRVYALPLGDDAYASLAASVRWEDVAKGRRGAVLARARGDLAPLVRSTTRHRAPAQRFGALHARLARRIEDRASLSTALDHALVEHYANGYASMGAHSDLALDLREGSSIALFSCYARPFEGDPPRRLVVEEKRAGGARFEVPLHHQSVVVFSVAANRRFRHKIVLDPSQQTPENPWLGVTLRASKTLVRYDDGGARFADGAPLTLADDAQQREFFSLRRRENDEEAFDWPRVGYTVSESDLVAPAPAIG